MENIPWFTKHVAFLLGLNHPTTFTMQTWLVKQVTRTCSDVMQVITGGRHRGKCWTKDPNTLSWNDCTGARVPWIHKAVPAQQQLGITQCVFTFSLLNIVTCGMIWQAFPTHTGCDQLWKDSLTCFTWLHCFRNKKSLCVWNHPCGTNGGYVVHYLQLDGQNDATTQTSIHM